MNLNAGFQFSWPLIYYFLDSSSLQTQIIITRDRRERAQIQMNTYIHVCVRVHVYIKPLPVKGSLMKLEESF